MSKAANNRLDASLNRRGIMTIFDWRNKPRTTTSPKNKHVVAEPLPITFNGTTWLSGTEVKLPKARIYKPKAAP